MSDNVALGFLVEADQGDVLKYPADVLAVKHTPSSAGLSAQVRRYLQEDADMLPSLNEYRIWPGSHVAQAGLILMVGAPPVFSLRYPQLRALGRRFLEALWEAGADPRHMITTLHGAGHGAGLDEAEIFRSLLLGMADAYAAGHYPPTLERITFVEKDPNRVRVMHSALQRFLPQPPPAPVAKRETATIAVMAGLDSFEPAYRKPAADDTTPHVFVAMPFAEEYDDQYYLAIQPAIHDCGLLSERMDLDAFTGDIKARMLARIRSARLLIALLDGHNPNVYLEIGYAWGVDTPTVLLAHNGEPLPFDVRGERVLIYDRIYRLKEMLAAELNMIWGET